MKEFDSRAEEYDAWYDENQEVFRKEIELIRGWARGSPALEIGVGTGRFASGLGIGFGIDMARGALLLARRRGIRAVLGSAESLPFKSESFALVGVFFSIEFFGDPRRALEECRRVLLPGGRLIVLHLLPSESLEKKRGKGFYSGMRRAYFPHEITRMAQGLALADRSETGELSALLFVKA